MYSPNQLYTILYRDMYKVVNQHAESFSYAYEYVGVPRYVHTVVCV